MAGAVKIGLEVTGAKAITRALRFLAEDNAPYLREAMERVGQAYRWNVAKRAPGSMAQKTQFVGVSGKGARLSAVVKINHPGANPMEFGRLYYYRDYTRAARAAAAGGVFRTKEGKVSKKLKAQQVNIAKGTKFRSSPGQKARPMFGIIKQDAAYAATMPTARAVFEEAISKEWLRIAGGPD